MEETIGYEALFSADEWDSLDLYDEGGPGSWDVGPDGESVEGSHTCTIYSPPGEVAGNENRFEIECGRCGIVDSADSEPEAQAIARLHEAFVATLVENWSVGR